MSGDGVERKPVEVKVSGFFPPGTKINFDGEGKHIGYVTSAKYDAKLMQGEAIVKITDDEFADMFKKEYLCEFQTDIKLEPYNKNSIVEIGGYLSIKRKKVVEVRKKKLFYDGSCAWIKYVNETEEIAPDRFQSAGMITSCHLEWLKPEARTMFESLRWTMFNTSHIELDLPLENAQISVEQVRQAERDKSYMVPVPVSGDSKVLVMRRDEARAIYDIANITDIIIDGKMDIQALPGNKTDALNFKFRMRAGDMENLKFSRRRDEHR